MATVRLFLTASEALTKLIFEGEDARPIIDRVYCRVQAYRNSTNYPDLLSLIVRVGCRLDTSPMRSNFRPRGFGGSHAAVA